MKSVTAVTCTAEHLLSVSLESVLCIWDRARGECLHRLKQVGKGGGEKLVNNNYLLTRVRSLRENLGPAPCHIGKAEV